MGNYFRRVCKLFKIMFVTYTRSEEKYDQISRICFSLTNYHTSLYPLRSVDGDFYISVLSRYMAMGESNKTMSHGIYYAK